MDQNSHLLLLPGMLCDGAFWCAQIDALADICATSVASYGLSDSIDAMAQIVLADAPETFALAGHSMGGRVALEVYKRAPQRVLKLGLFCTDYRGHVSDEARKEELSSRGNMLALARARDMESVAREWVARVVSPDRLKDKKLVSAVMAMAARHSPAVLEAQIHAGLTRPDFSGVLPTITCPTLICAGEEDTMRPLEIHQDMAARLSTSRLAVIERSGHMVAMEQPRAVSEAMRNWLLS